MTLLLLLPLLLLGKLTASRQAVACIHAATSSPQL
jgi:hypothetical protein